MTFDEEKYEKEKAVRRRLRGKQLSLKKQFQQVFKKESLLDPEWQKLSGLYIETLREDAKINPHWIDTERYPLAFYNLFSALGFEIHAGNIPRVSGVAATYRMPLLAFHPSRAILLDNRPSWVFTDLADIQPLCPVPILGMAYNGIVWSKPDNRGWGSDYPTQSLLDGRRMANALALGHLTLSFLDIQEALALHPERNREQLLKIAERTGLISFIFPPIDSLPLFGQHLSSNNGWNYGLKQFLAEAGKAKNVGAELSTGDITKAKPEEAIADPEYYIKELRKAKLINSDNPDKMGQTQGGWSYLRSRVLPFPLGQLLHHTCMAAREEVREVAKTFFVNALRQKNSEPFQKDLGSFVSIEEIDSFAKISFVPPHSVKENVPVKNSEQEVKTLICGIIGDQSKKDWGGESNDIFTTRVIYKGKRIAAAFLLKGPAVKGRLTIAKCGKNGDQIQRLFQSPAELFVIQFNGEIDERIVEEARQKVSYLRMSGFENTVFTIIDGLDTARLLSAYS